MGLEINKKGLSGSALNAIECSITAADKDKNGISQEEVSVFATELKKYKDAGWLSKKEYKQVIDSLEITDETAEAEEAPTETVTTKKEKRQADRKVQTDAKRNENTTLRALDEVAFAGTERKDLISKLNDKLGTNSEQENFIELKATIKKVIEESQKLEYKDLKDINKNEKALRKALKSEKIDDKVLNQIIDAVNASIKTEKVTEAYDEIINIHTDLISKFPLEHKNVNLDKLTRAVLTQLVVSGKVDGEDVVKQSNGTYKIENNTKYADAYNRYLSEAITREAGEIWLDSLVQQKDLKARNVKKGTINNIKDNNDYDAYVENYANSNFGDSNSGYKKVKNIDSEIKARFNNVKALSIQTEDEILNVLGKKSEVFDALVGQKIITKREDGSYDISKLQAELIKQIGADAKVNRHAKIDEAISEIRAALTKAQDLTKLNSLTDDELKDLFKLCGFPVESKVNFGEVMKRLANGLLVGTLSGAGAFALTPISVDPTPLDINVDVNLISGSKLSGATLPKELIGSVIETETGVTVNIKGLIGGVSGLVTLLRYIGPIAYKSALIGGAAELLGGLITGNGKGGEVSITRLKTEEETLEQYVKRVKDENPNYAEVFEMFAKAFVKEDGTWDRTGYRSFLDEIAGSDKLNSEELRSKLIDYTEKLANTPVDKKQDDKKDKVNNITADKGQGVHNYTEEEDMLEIDGLKTSWANVAKMYDRCIVPPRDTIDREKYPNCYRRYNELAVRFIKVAQAIKPDATVENNYSMERLLELAEKTFAAKTSKYTELANETSIDHKVLVDTMNADWLGKVKVPKKLAGCTRIKDEAEDAIGMKREGAEDAPVAPVSDKEITHHQKPVYGLKVGDGELKTFDNMNDRNTEYAKLVNEYREKGYDVQEIEKLSPEEVQEAYKKQHPED